MKRPVIIIIGVVVVFMFGAIAVWKKTRQIGAVEGYHAGLSDERKTAIRSFWEIYSRATDLKQQGAWRQAVSAYRQALEIDPGHEDALYYLGNSLFELERYEEATAAWRRLVAVNPMSARAHAQLGAVYSCGAPKAPFDLDEAEREFQQVLSINKEESGPMLKLGEVALLKGERERALSWLTAAGRTNFKSVEAHYLIGYIRWLEGDRAAAMAALRQAVTFGRGDHPVRGVEGEGDTKKKAARPIVADGADRKSLFSANWKALQDWGSVSPIKMEEEYSNLDRVLRRISRGTKQR